MRRLSALAFSLLLLSTLGCRTSANGAEPADDSENAVAKQSGSHGESGDESTPSPKGKKLELLSRLPDVVDQALPAVVGISTRKVVESRRPQSPFGNHPFFRQFPFDQRRQPRQQRGMGSGVIVSEDGRIITNNHVVEGADEIRVSFSDRRDEYKATIVGTDPATDIAVLKLKNPPADLKPITIGDSESVRLGEPVVAIGNPFGLSGTVTYGIVSAKGRANVGLAEYEDFIQTDAAINPGNSGGALVNMEGELIGINTAILSRSGGYQGIGFAIPSKMAQSVMNKLVSTGEVQRGWLGVVIQTLSPELAEGFGLPEETEGVAVASVKEGSPADKAGLKRGDVIVGFEGNPVTSANELRNIVAQQTPGESVELKVLRGDNTRKVSVKLGALNEARGGKVEVERTGILQGLVLGPPDREAREKFNLPDRIDTGVVVLDVKPGTPAAQTGLQPGDVILEVNRRQVESAGQLTEAYEKAERRLLLLVYRQGHTVFLTIPKLK